MSSGYNIATLPLNVSSNCTGTSATWDIPFMYTSTSGVTYQGEDATATSTLGQSTNWQSTPGVGGQGNITVSASVSSAGAPATTVTTTLHVYIDGTSIPNSSITGQLTSLYSGATPALLTGIAMAESSYQQFVSRTFGSVSGLWPIKNQGTSKTPPGAFVGLMQVPNAMNVAFDWTQNTSAGAAVFQSKLSSATSQVNSWYAQYPSLPKLTGQPLENSALCLYAGYGNPYYYPNSSGNSWLTYSNCASYVSNVRSQIQ